jgi:hypothetical protein
MKSQISIMSLLALVASLFPQITTEAATIWNGPPTLFAHGV